MSSITSLTGKKVTVYSRLGDAEKQDVGVLEEADQNWLILKKADGDVWYFTLYNVRAVKPFDPH